MIVSRKRSAPSLKRTRSSKVEIEATVDRQRESTGGMGNGREAGSEEGVETEYLRHGSKRTLERMSVVRRASGEIGQKMTKRLEFGAEMKAGKSDINYFSKTKVSEKLTLVK